MAPSLETRKMKGITRVVCVMALERRIKMSANLDEIEQASLVVKRICHALLVAILSRFFV